MIPGQVTLIPTYIILKHVPFFGGNDFLGQGGHGWLDSYWGLIIPQEPAPSLFSSCANTCARFRTICSMPRIDGASELRIWAQIVMPLCVPALAALGIFTFTYQWDNFYWPLVIVSSEDLHTAARSGALRRPQPDCLGSTDGRLGGRHPAGADLSPVPEALCARDRHERAEVGEVVSRESVGASNAPHALAARAADDRDVARPAA